jgi:hypothetical protein
MAAIKRAFRRDDERMLSPVTFYVLDWLVWTGKTRATLHTDTRPRGWNQGEGIIKKFQHNVAGQSGYHE